uniref:Phospholipase A2 n=1 Tax=Hypochilus sp. SGP-2016 TaxID=1905178 RepID=A0A482ZI33_9ARAC
MKECTLLLTLLLSVTTITTVGRILRQKRDLLDLVDMFEDITALDPTDFIPYGNWCGYGGGGEAVDHIDRCCEVHDNCYGLVAEKECPNQQVHIVQYYWKTSNGTAICDEKQTLCEFKVCECDKNVVECIVRHNNSYNEEHRFIRYDDKR